MKTILSILDKRSPKIIWRLVLALVILISAFSTVFGKVIFAEFFYIFPIVLASWYGSKKSGIILAVISTVFLLSIKALHTEFEAATLFNYGLPCLITLSVLAILITNFRNVHRIESIAADSDNLTGIYNSRGFYIELANELVRSSRYEHIFSLAYLDIDNFKFVNDSQGHASGDELLIGVANCLRNSLRATDTVARLGGDEFACLLPETGQEEAKVAFAKASTRLEKRMIRDKWPVSFSVGMVTFEIMPSDIKEAIKIADELMYSVKNSDKNNISYKIWHGKV
ncbi:MAG: GGDEF domain-containing protein [Kangiellaceae bacterium]|nr:GGDEF domain-containing protein [Kangiellaceae bacterium]MCW9017430.1 GGDEF domain-containing protein [Kangiellaceae bacterium]